MSAYEALAAAYKFITQPQRIGGGEATYSTHDYDRVATTLRAAMADLERQRKQETGLRFATVSCSNCGRAFGPGDHGFSHCDNHAGLAVQS